MIRNYNEDDELVGLLSDGYGEAVDLPDEFLARYDEARAAWESIQRDLRQLDRIVTAAKRRRREDGEKWTPQDIGTLFMRRLGSRVA